MGISPEYNSRINDAIKTSVDEGGGSSPPSNQVTFSTGVVIRLKKVSVMLIQNVTSKFKYPDVPKVKDEERGRLIDNPDDPHYKKACEQIDVERSMAMIDTIIVAGTELVHRPDNVPAVESDEWIDTLRIVGLDVDVSHPLTRWLAWVKFVAMPDTEDMSKLAQQFGLSVGASEERVAHQLQNSFQDSA